MKNSCPVWQISQSAMKFLYVPQQCHFVQTQRCNTIPVAASLCKNLVFPCVLKHLCAMYPSTRDHYLYDIPSSFRTQTVILVLSFHSLEKLGDIIDVRKTEIIILEIETNLLLKY